MFVFEMKLKEKSPMTCAYSFIYVDRLKLFSWKVMFHSWDARSLRIFAILLVCSSTRLDSNSPSIARLKYYVWNIMRSGLFEFKFLLLPWNIDAPTKFKR